MKKHKTQLENNNKKNHTNKKKNVKRLKQFCKTYENRK